MRAGVAFYGKNTLAITRRHGSWVVLGTLITDRDVEPTPPLDAGCGSCTLCIDACPTGALDEPGTLDATRCLSYWTQAPAPIPRVPRGARRAVYGCDICQDVCPWNRGVEKRRAGAGRRTTASRRRRSSTGSRATATSCASATTGSTCRGTIRAGCAGTRSSRGECGRRPRTRGRGHARGRRRRASPRARPVGARPDRRAERIVKLIREPRLRPRRARAAGGDQGRARPRRLSTRRRDTSGRPGPWSAAFAAVALLLVWLSFRWRGRLRYLAALSVVTDFAITTP